MGQDAKRRRRGRSSVPELPLLSFPAPGPEPTPVPASRPSPDSPRADATAITGAKKVTKKCCRSTPRCKGCPVVLMRTARLQESGLTGKDLKKAVRRARAA